MKIFCAVLTVVGCVVGIGFSSGKELAIFFDGLNPVFVSLCFFVLFFVATLLFFALGKNTGAYDLFDLNQKLFGKWSFAFDFVFVVTCFLSCAVMLAGAQNLWVQTFDNNFCFSLFVALFCAMSLYFGFDKVKRVGIVFVLVIVLMLALVCVTGRGGVLKTSIDVGGLFGVAKYVCYNCVLGGCVFLNCAKTLCKRQLVAVSAISSGVLSLLIFLILSAIHGGEMPMLLVAKNSGLYIPFVIAVFCGLLCALTSCSLTVVNWVYNKSRDKGFSVAVVYMCAYLLSMFGFGKILSVVLPFSCAFSVLFAICGVVYLCKNKGNG